MLKCAPVITRDGVRDALELARRIFAALPEATPQATASFERATELGAVMGGIMAGELKLWGCADTDLRAMCALRGGNHVMLLFVDERYRRHGIGEALVEAMRDEALAQGASTLTANATPSSAGFYRRLGFSPTAEVQQRDGIAYLPVQLTL